MESAGHESPVGHEAIQEPLNLPFESYELLCNINNRASRKSGILSDEIYAEALADPTTVFCEVDGVNIPVLVDIHHGLGLGYDETRARGYANPDVPVSALALPIGDLDDDMKKKVVRTIAASGSRSIFFADNEGRDGQTLRDGLTAAGREPSEVPLLDRRCRPDNRQASLSLYVCDNTLPDYEPGAARVPLAEAQRHFDEVTRRGIADATNAALLRRGDSFASHELDDIWELYLDKFQLLGENHPISMEDGKDDFLGILTDPSTVASIRYVDAKPACFTYFTDDFSSMYWLNKEYLDRLADQKPGLTSIFFPGIVSRKGDGGYAADVIRLFAQETAAAGINDRIIFENTNLSEMYVPRIIFDSVDGQSDYSVERPHKVDQTHYRLLET